VGRHGGLSAGAVNRSPRPILEAFREPEPACRVCLSAVCRAHGRVPFRCGARTGGIVKAMKLVYGVNMSISYSCSNVRRSSDKEIQWNSQYRNSLCETENRRDAASVVYARAQSCSSDNRRKSAKQPMAVERAGSVHPATSSNRARRRRRGRIGGTRSSRSDGISRYTNMIILYYCLCRPF
jgi:hypothetical protein